MCLAIALAELPETMNAQPGLPAISPWIPIGFFLAAFAMYGWAMLHARLVRIRSALTIALAVLGVRSMTVVIPAVGYLIIPGAELVTIIGVLILAAGLLLLEFQFQSGPRPIDFRNVQEEHYKHNQNPAQVSKTLKMSQRRVEAIIECLIISEKG